MYVRNIIIKGNLLKIFLFFFFNFYNVQFFWEREDFFFLAGCFLCGCLRIVIFE